MAINYVDKYGKELDQKLVFGTYTNELETSNLLWLDAKTFKIQTITTTGLKPHTRNKGYNEGSASNENTAYTITFDRDVEFFVDVMDVDETGQALTAANVTKEFNSRHSAPEVDAYRFSKLATEAKKNGYSTAETITEENVFRTLKAAIRKVKKYGTQNLVMYVSVDVMAALELSIEDLVAHFKKTFPAIKTLGFIKQTGLDSMVVINEAPTFQNKQVQTQSRVRESIGFLIYDKNTIQCKRTYDLLRNYFLLTNPSELNIQNQKVVATDIASGGQVDYDDDGRLIYQLTILFEKEM